MEVNILRKIKLKFHSAEERTIFHQLIKKREIQAQIDVLNNLFRDLNDDTLTELYNRINSKISELEAELKESK